MKPETIAAGSALVQAFAAVASLIVAAVLAYITHKYAKLTQGILDETSKARKASEDSARAARDSVNLMRQQLEEQTGLGAFIVASTIDTVVNEIEPILQPQPLRNQSVPKSISRLNILVEQRAESAVNHAARINVDVAQQLTS
jgi:hypothetical protein